MSAIRRATETVCAGAYPDRSFNVGIAESNMVSIAGRTGFLWEDVPVIASFRRHFLLDNAFDQIRMSIAFPNLNVKMVGTHTGISIGEDGPSQMGVEDIALACSLPGITVVVVPSDAACTAAAIQGTASQHEGPTYHARRTRKGRPTIYPDGCDFDPR